MEAEKTVNQWGRRTSSRLILAACSLTFACVAAIVGICLLTHPFDSPLRHQYGQALHGLIWMACGSPPADEWGSYTGVVRFWDDRGVLRHREQYENGDRCGVWIRYNAQGAIERVCEYRDGEPWNGVCNVVDGKAWLLEYRDGKPWNGVEWRSKSEDFCYLINGVASSADEFRDHHELGDIPADDLVWQPQFTRQELTQPLGVKLPADMASR